MNEANNQTFTGQVAIVTGAGKGLGKAYAEFLSRHGCAVVINNRAHPGIPSSAQAVVDGLKAEGHEAIAHNGAIDDPAAVADLIALAISAFGGLDILVCNAGVMPEAPFGELAQADIAQLVNINILGTIYPLQAAWQHMIQTGYGRIVLTGSTVGVYGYPNVAVYGATRGAVIGLARSLTQEKPAAADITINTIMPFAYTNLSSASLDQAMPAEVIGAVQPDKISPTVGWLCSKACNRSGQTFHAAALKVTRIGIVESAPVAVDPEDIAALSDAPFSLEPLFEPIDSVTAVGRLLGGG